MEQQTKNWQAQLCCCCKPQFTSVYVNMTVVQLPCHSICVFVCSKIKHDDSLVSHYTGLPDDKTVACLLNFFHLFNTVFHSCSIISLSHEDQILLTLMKLHHNFTHTHLGFLFSITKVTVTNIVSAWIDILHSLLFSGILTEIGIPS